jgi:hypothetical protein
MTIFQNFEKYSNLKKFCWIDGILRFNFKTAYDFVDSPEAKVRKEQEFRLGEVQRQTERNATYQRELERQRRAQQKIRELGLKLADEELSQEQSQQKEIDDLMKEIEKQKSKSITSSPVAPGDPLQSNENLEKKE